MRTFCLIKYFIYFFAFVIFGFACQQKKQEINTKKSNSQIVDTLMAKGNGYYAIGNLDSAVAVLLRAMPIVNELPKKDKYAEINRRLGEYYRATHNYAEAKPHLWLAINLAKKHEFRTILAKSYGRRAAVANEENDFDSAYFYLQKTLAISEDTNLLIATYNELGQIFTSEQNKNRNLDSALFFLKKAFELPTDDNIKANLLANMGRLYQVKGEQSKAENLYKNAEEQGRKNGNRGAVWMSLIFLSDFYLQTKQYNKAALQYKHTLAYKDTIFNLNLNQQLAKLELQFENEKKQQAIQNLENEKQNTQKLQWATWLILLLLLIILLVIFLRFRLQIKVNQQQQMIYRSDAERQELLLQKQKTENALIIEEAKALEEENKRIANEQENQHKELSLTVLYLNEKNMLIQQLKEILDGKSDTKQKNVDSLLNQHKFMELEWEKVKKQMEQISPQLLQNLLISYPSLTPAEQKLCAYTYLGLDNQSIATLSNISLESVHVARSRLKKKLNLSIDQDLTTWVKQF